MKKTKKLNCSYKKFEHNWLYVFFEFSCLEEAEIEEAMCAWRERANKYKINFDRIFINTIDQIFVVQKEGIVEKISVSDKALKQIKKEALKKAS